MNCPSFIKFNPIYCAFLVCLTVVFTGLPFSTIQAQQCDIIYVSPNGATSGVAGTFDTPAEINYAITLLTPSVRRIYLAQGNYSLSSAFPILVNDVTFEGGFVPGLGWAKSNSLKTQIVRDTNNVLPNPNRIVGITADGVSGLVIQDVTILVKDAKTMGRGISVYGVYLNNCSNYKLTRCVVRAGNAGNGDIGADGQKGSDGGDGLIGDQGKDDKPGNNAGGNGGNAWSGGSASGGKGGNGGAAASCNSIFSSPTAFNGDQGQDAVTALGGNGGTGGQKFTTILNITGCINDGTRNMDGADGDDGLPGDGAVGNPLAYDGADGVASHTGGFFQPGNAQPGLKGQNGGGGGGGGGGSSAGVKTVVFFCTTESVGGGGGGGGEGGEGGDGGGGGGGGGGSFGIYINNGGPGGFLRDTYYQSGLVGQGVFGGTGGFGGLGGFGGPGGGKGLQGQPIACDYGRGGDGGNGAIGGKGGKGGKGANGVSASIYVSPNTPFGNVDSLILSKPNEPNIIAKFNGCTETDVTFIIQASGNVTWFLGSGANPVSASGSSVTVRYATMGRKTITALVNGESFTYSEFIDIRSSGAGLKPSIVAASDTICAGAIPTFTSSINSSLYRWNFGGAFPPIENATANSVNANTYDVAGDYLVTLQTYSACCGFSDVDTFRFYVRPNPQPSVSIVSNGTITQICKNECVIYVATAVNAGDSPQYQWFVNGSIASNTVNSPVFTTCLLNDNDQISCKVTVTNACLNAAQVASNTLSIQVLTIPQIDPQPNGGCFGLTTPGNKYAPGEIIKFNVAASGGAGNFVYIWDFGNSSGGLGQNTSTIYTGPGHYPVSVYAVDGFGCKSLACVDTVVINNYAEANFKVDTLVGCAPFKVKFKNESKFSVTYLWNFGDGSANSVQFEPEHIYSTPGIYDVQLTSFGSFINDSSIVLSQVVVNPKPVADFIAVPAFVNNPKDSVIFAAGSIDASTWSWNFGDPASGSDNFSDLPNPMHFYEAEGFYTVKLVVTNAFGCVDSITKSNFVQKKILVSVDDIATGEIVKQVYPNPFADKFILDLNLSKSARLNIRLLDITGQTVRHLLNETRSAGEFSFEVDQLQNLPPGAYILTIEANGAVSHYKLIRSAY